MQTAEDLRREAEATERLAAMVSYRPDKDRLMKVAGELRTRAAQVEAREQRSWKPTN